MAEVLQRLTRKEGFTYTALDNVSLMRANSACERTPVLYDPCLVIVCQGRKWGFVGERSFPYDAQHYLALTLPLPFSCIIEATPEEPLLAIKIGLDLRELADLLLHMELYTSGEQLPKHIGIASTPLDDALGDAVLRLVELLESERDLRVLGPGLIREIYYRALSGEQGPAICAAFNHYNQYGRIARAVRRIHTDFQEQLQVSMLAEEARMSVPAFHASFKAMTGTSPIQYVKATRLHQARRLMVRGGLSAAAAALSVGYESPSQFGREFKRLFGSSPLKEARAMREQISQQSRSVVSANAPLSG